MMSVAKPVLCNSTVDTMLSGTTISTTSSTSLVKNVVVKSSTLCVGDFTPLNDFTETKIEQMEQHRHGRNHNRSSTRQVVVPTATESLSPMSSCCFSSSTNVGKKMTGKRFNFLRRNSSLLSKVSKCKMLRRTSTMSSSFEEHCSDISSVESFFGNNNNTVDLEKMVLVENKEEVDIGNVDQDDVSISSDCCCNTDLNTVVSTDCSEPTVGTNATEDELLSLSSKMTVPMHEQPDMYGQVHPIENDTLIDQALYIFEQQWKLLPSSKSNSAFLAEANCPEIVSIRTPAGRQFKLQFVRCEVYRINDAVERYVNYWTKRIELFGSDRAFKPITMDTLTENERHILSNNYISYLPSTLKQQQQQQQHDQEQQSDDAVATTTSTLREQRAMMFVDYSGFQPSTMANNDFVRALWYMIQTITTDCLLTQQRGLVVVATARTTTNANSPSLSFYGRILPFLKKTIPLRISGYHVVYPPSYLKFLYPLTCAFLSRNKMKMRLMVHMNISNDTELLEQFSTKYGIYQEQLPTSVGGTYRINEKQWIQEQIRQGK